MTVLRSGSATDVGRRRRVNEDLTLETDNLFAVADGMGGHVGGEVAARVAVDALAQEFDREPTTAGLQGAFAKANRAVWQESQEHIELRGMGTTLTAVALVGGADGRDTLALANVGDSRAYIFSQGQITQITADHSLAEERMRQGEITEAEAAVHPQRHILTRVLGVFSEVEADMWELQLRSGDRVLLCSDGLSNELDLTDMANVLASVPDPADAAHQLVDVANAHGGNDNITAVVVDVLVGEEGDEPATVVTPIGAGAGVPLVLAAGGRGGAGGAGGRGGAGGAGGAGTTGEPAGASAGGSGVSPSGSLPDHLAPGAQLGFTGVVTALKRDEPGSDGFFDGQQTQAVPVARSTVRAATPAARQTASLPPTNESRGARRRRLGIPRRITIRVALFVLLVAAVPVAAYFAIRWYAYDNWFLSVKGNEIVVQQGHPGGVLWFDPKVVDRTGVTTSKVLPTGLAQIHSGVQEPTLGGAKRYVANLHAEYEFLHTAAAQGKNEPGATGPSGAIPTTIPPPKSTTTTKATTSTTSSTTNAVVPTTQPVTTTTAAPVTTTTVTVTTDTAAP